MEIFTFYIYSLIRWSADTNLWHTKTMKFCMLPDWKQSSKCARDNILQMCKLERKKKCISDRLQVTRSLKVTNLNEKLRLTDNR